VESKPRGLCIATRCRTADELVEKLAPCCDEGWLFVNTNTVRAVGSEAPLAVMLVDKTVVLRGWCVVFDAWSTADNPFGKPGMRLGVHRLTPSSMDVFERMLDIRKAAVAQGRTVRHSTQAIAIVDMPTTTPTMIGIPVVAAPRRTVTIPPLVASPAEEVTDPTERMATPPLHDLGNAPVVEPPKPKPIAPTAFASKPLPPPISQLLKPPVAKPNAESTSSSTDANGLEPITAQTIAASAAKATALASMANGHAAIAANSNPTATSMANGHGAATSSKATAPASTANGREATAAQPVAASRPASSDSAKGEGNARAGVAPADAESTDSSNSSNGTVASVANQTDELFTTNAAGEPLQSAAARPRAHERARTSLGSPRSFRPPARVAARGTPRGAANDSSARTPSTKADESAPVSAFAVGRSPQGTPVRVDTDSDRPIRIAQGSMQSAPITPTMATEIRTPGSPLVLPANPLMNLTDASLEGFVDCRLYEEMSPSAEPKFEPELESVTQSSIVVPPGLNDMSKSPTRSRRHPGALPHTPTDAPALVASAPRASLVRTEMSLDAGGLISQPRTRTGMPTGPLPIAMTFPISGEATPTARGSSMEIQTATITTPLLARGSSRHTTADPLTPPLAAHTRTHWRTLVMIAAFTGLLAFTISFALAH
jgi:hypothetical protein